MGFGAVESTWADDAGMNQKVSMTANSRQFASFFMG